MISSTLSLKIKALSWVQMEGSVRILGKAKSGSKLQIFKKIVYIIAGANSKYLITYQGSFCKFIGRIWNKGKAKSGSRAIKRCSKIFTIMNMNRP